MSIDLLSDGRAMAESLMVDTCRIERRSGSTAGTRPGETVATYTLVYEGRCRFQLAGLATRQVSAGQQTVTVGRVELQLPVTVIDVDEDDRVTSLTSVDPALPGRKFRVQDAPAKTHATKRVLGLETWAMAGAS